MSEARGGAHAGRGPKGYARSDQRLYEEVCERLMRNPEVDAAEIEVSVQEGVVHFRGTVPDRWTKFLVEDLAEGVLGVRELVNELRLRRD
jgi:osmotically-inducible protein OsmY